MNGSTDQRISGSTDQRVEGSADQRASGSADQLLSGPTIAALLAPVNVLVKVASALVVERHVALAEAFSSVDFWHTQDDA